METVSFKPQRCKLKFLRNMIHIILLRDVRNSIMISLWTNSPFSVSIILFIIYVSKPFIKLIAIILVDLFLSR